MIRDAVKPSVIFAGAFQMDFTDQEWPRSLSA